jgi:hypothetical protein
MLNENAVLNTQDVGRNPIHWETHATEGKRLVNTVWSS